MAITSRISGLFDFSRQVEQSNDCRITLNKTSTMPTIRIDISHVGLGMEFKELPFDDTTSLGQLKDKLYPFNLLYQVVPF